MTTTPLNTQSVSLARRLGAIFYDALLIGSTVLIVGAIIATIISQFVGTGRLAPDTTLSRFFFIIDIGLAFALFGWFWTHGGQTLGMRAWKIRVVDQHGQNLDWQQAFFRFVSAIVSWLALGVGFWIAIFDPDKLTWHDRFSRTYLVRTDT